jgi:uroporphyrinogen-III synthase
MPALRVLSFESRRAREMEALLRQRGWEPTVVPVFAEVPQEDPAEAHAFGRDLLAGSYEQVIFLTGVGVRHLWRTLLAVHGDGELREALQRTVTVARGPKPAAALREIGVKPGLLIREPATWREILGALEGEPRRRTAVIEYGRHDHRLSSGLREMGVPHQVVAVYHYGFPEDFGHVREALEGLAEGRFEVVLFTASIQYLYLSEAAERLGMGEEWKKGLRQMVVASIGPTMTETLEADQIPVSFEPTVSRMGILVYELEKLLSAGA